MIRDLKIYIGNVCRWLWLLIHWKRILLYQCEYIIKKMCVTYWLAMASGNLETGGSSGVTNKNEVVDTTFS